MIRLFFSQKKIESSLENVLIIDYQRSLCPLRDSWGNMKKNKRASAKSPAALKRDARVEPIVAHLFVFLDCLWAERETARSLHWLWSHGPSERGELWNPLLWSLKIVWSSEQNDDSGSLELQRNVTESWSLIFSVLELWSSGALPFSC